MKCKVCDSDMELVDHTSVCVGGDGWNTPYEYEITEEWYCSECGERVFKTYII